MGLIWKDCVYLLSCKLLIRKCGFANSIWMNSVVFSKLRHHPYHHHYHQHLHDSENLWDEASCCLQFSFQWIGYRLAIHMDFTVSTFSFVFIHWWLLRTFTSLYYEIYLLSWGRHSKSGQIGRWQMLICEWIHSCLGLAWNEKF